MHLPTGFKIDTVDDTVGMNVFSVDMRTDQHLAALEISGKLPCCFVRCARVNVCALREALHHVVKHHAAILVVQQLRTQKLIERGFRLAANAADELLTVPERFIHLRHIPHDAFHAAARLRSLSEYAVLMFLALCKLCVMLCHPRKDIDALSYVNNLAIQ